jgi:hypothetical protein
MCKLPLHSLSDPIRPPSPVSLVFSEWMHHLFHTFPFTQSYQPTHHHSNPSSPFSFSRGAPTHTQRMARAEQLREEDLKAWEQQEQEQEQGQEQGPNATEGGDDDGARSPALHVHTRLAALGLKEGEKLRLSLGHAMEGRAPPHHNHHHHRHNPTLSASSPGAAIDGVTPLLPPPPGDRSPAVGGILGRQKQEQEGGKGAEEEWGDFVA